MSRERVHVCPGVVPAPGTSSDVFGLVVVGCSNGPGRVESLIGGRPMGLPLGIELTCEAPPRTSAMSPKPARSPARCSWKACSSGSRRSKW